MYFLNIIYQFLKGFILNIKIVNRIYNSKKKHNNKIINEKIQFLQ